MSTKSYVTTFAANFNHKCKHVSKKQPFIRTDVNCTDCTNKQSENNINKMHAVQ